MAYHQSTTGIGGTGGLGPSVQTAFLKDQFLALPGFEGTGAGWWTFDAAHVDGTGADAFLVNHVRGGITLTQQSPNQNLSFDTELPLNGMFTRAGVFDADTVLRQDPFPTTGKWCKFIIFKTLPSNQFPGTADQFVWRGTQGTTENHYLRCRRTGVVIDNLIGDNTGDNPGTWVKAPSFWPHGVYQAVAASWDTDAVTVRISVNGETPISTVGTTETNVIALGFIGGSNTAPAFTGRIAALGFMHGDDADILAAGYETEFALWRELALHCLGELNV